MVLSFRAQQIKFQDEMERLKTENVRIQNEADDKVRDFLQFLALSVLISNTDMVCVQNKAARLVCSLQPTGSAGLLGTCGLMSALAPCVSNMPREPCV